MLLKKTFLAILIVGITLGPVPALAKVNYISQSEQTRQALLAHIELLMAEVERLQALLDNDRQVLEVPKEERLVVSKIRQKPYPSVHFKFPYEEIYFLDDADLINSDGSDVIRRVDEKIYDLFTNVVGEDVFDSKVRELRIFHDEDSEVGAFVELIAGTDDWVVGVNRFEFDDRDKRVARSFVNLFIHEYAHILLYDQPEFEKEFANDFWTGKDYRHKVKVEEARDSERFDITSRYYNRNEDRFVSDYATINEYEDMAETFVFFILEDIPVGDSLRSKKIRSFYKEAKFVKERREIRANLQDLNLL